MLHRREYLPYRVGFWTTRMSKKKTPMTIGIFNEHAFLITDLEKAIGTYACAHRGAHARVMWKGVQTEKPKLNAQAPVPGKPIKLSPD